jgi:hypothetical protein
MSVAHAPSPIANEVRIITGPEPNPNDRQRRRSNRFPLIGQAQYTVAGNRAAAPIRDISSGGVFLKTDRILRIGQQIRVFIDWPVLLENRCPLRLVIDGKVLRSDPSGTAVSLTKYEFRIAPKLMAHPQSAAR